jgi:hypothetical protein
MGATQHLEQTALRQAWQQRLLLHFKLPRQIQCLFLFNAQIELGRRDGLVTKHDLASADVAGLAVDQRWSGAADRMDAVDLGVQASECHPLFDQLQIRSFAEWFQRAALWTGGVRLLAELAEHSHISTTQR